jgi:hypothetical protein
MLRRLRRDGRAATSLATFSSTHNVRKMRTKATAGAKMARTLTSTCPNRAAPVSCKPKGEGPPKEEGSGGPQPGHANRGSDT